MKELNKEELDEIGWAILNLSQDIRFAIEFEMVDHETLACHLTETLKNIENLDKIILDGKLGGIRKVARIMADKIFNLKGDD